MTLEGAKPWQMVLVVVALLVLTSSIVYQCMFSADSIPMADSVVLVDVNTGELFEAPFPEKKAVSYPAKHPTTKTETLFPAVRKDGKWYVLSRYSPLAVDRRNPKPLPVGAFPAIIDRATGELKVSGDKPKRARVFEGS